MQVSDIGPFLPIKPIKTGEIPQSGGSFTEIFTNAMKKLNEAEIKSDNLTVELLTGEIQDIHQVTVAMQEAKLTMQLAVEVRNKIIEAYQEISRMQV